MADSRICRALISVTDKTGVVEFARALQEEFGVEIISTGGTARALQEGGVDVIPIEDYTGFPEMMGGRVKTLHPLVHGGLLCRRSDPDHMADAEANGIKMIDLVAVNLYEFEKTVAKPDVTYADAIEHIDIGGPSMLRSAAKNHESVTVICDPADYDTVLDEMRSGDGATTLDTRKRLALKVFTTTAAYDTAISTWMRGALAAEGVIDADSSAADATSPIAADGTFIPPEELSVHLKKIQDLRYGENPHQNAAVYGYTDKHAELGSSAHPLVGAQQLNGKPLSYNNLLDADAAWNAVREFTDPAVVILKHQNPCGSAVAADAVEAYEKAYGCDPKSAFGGIVAVNRDVTGEFVEHMFATGQFVEVIVAPSFDEAALEQLTTKQNLRVLATGGTGAPALIEMRSIDGGMLVQCTDRVCEDPATFTYPTERKPTDEEMGELLFAWKVVKSVKSNAIIIAKDRAGLGMGPGQPNRVDSALLACERAEEACERLGIPAGNFACASDAFFPFRDNVDTLAAHGVTCIIQPGGSVRDDESIQACNEHGIAMVFTGTRHFRH